MQSPEKKDREQARQNIRELAVKLWQQAESERRAGLQSRKQQEFDDTDPWTLRRIDRLETQNVQLQVRVERLEHHQPAGNITPRYPNDAPWSREEQRAFLRRVGLHKTADLL